MKALRAIVAATVALGAGAASAEQPPVTTGAAQPTETSVHTVGYYNVVATACLFEYGATTAYGVTKEVICSGTSPTDLGPLIPGTLYHYRAYARTTSGNVYGEDKVFTTLGTAPDPGQPPPTPSVTLEAVKGQSLSGVRRKGLRILVGMPGPCPCQVRAKLLVPKSTARRLRIKPARSISLASNGKHSTSGIAKVTLKLRKDIRSKVRRLRRLKVTVRVTVVDAGGKKTSKSKAVALK